MVTHAEQLAGLDWHYVILDEGHKIRNPEAQVGLLLCLFGGGGGGGVWVWGVFLFFIRFFG